MTQRPILPAIPGLLAFILIFECIPLAAAPMETGRRVALVIGNSSYLWDRALENPRNDAEAFAEALQKVSPKFHVRKILDVKAKDNAAILSDFEKDASNSDIALFYYAGHAFQADDDNYLLPVDMPELLPPLPELGALRLNDVLGKMKGAIRAKLIFIDACRNNPYKNQVEALRSRATSPQRDLRLTSDLIRSLRDGLASPDTSNFGTGDVFIAYATAPGSVALDGIGKKNSPFTAALVRHLPKQGQEIKEMQTLVTKEVKQVTLDKGSSSRPQIPWFSVSLTANFYLWPALPGAQTSKGIQRGGRGEAPSSGPARQQTPPTLGGGLGAGGL